MEDVELVIKLDKYIYDALMHKNLMHLMIDQRCIADEMAKSIRKGTLIPKGHGKLKDTDKISDEIERLRDSWNAYGNEYESGKYEGYDYALDEVLYAPTIIEADNVESEK